MKDPLLSKITPLTRRQFSFALGGLVGYMMGCSPQNPSSDSPATTDTRFITHSLGTTEVPRDPQRIIALSGTADLESLLALEIQPIAAAGDDRGGGLTVWQPHLQPLMRDIEMLPSRRNISLETVTLLRPDLILGTIGHVRPIYEQLSKIAPTIALDTAQQVWDESFRLVAQCLNLELAAEVVIQEVQNKSQEVAQQYHDSVMGKTFACIQDGLDNNQVWVYHDTNAVRFLKQVGLTPSVTPADVSSEDPVGFYISVRLKRVLFSPFHPLTGIWAERLGSH
jgi:ABC-type Fe3+-hydroxamate transport system substrate-binding protein